MKGIILAGGSGTRLRPITEGASKQLLPVYDKPMIYYPLSVLMLAGISEILIISTPDDVAGYRRLLGDGSWLGIQLDYAVQPSPNGIAEAFLIGEDHIGDDDVALILGDNIFHGSGFSSLLRSSVAGIEGCVLFGYRVSDPERYGVGELDPQGRLVSIEEKPARPRSNLAITGLYFYDNEVVEIAKTLRPSGRGELEITDVNRRYLAAGRARLVDLGSGFAWLDSGTPDSLIAAGQFVQLLEQRQGIRIGCVEEIALRRGLISPEQCFSLGKRLAGSAYGEHVVACSGVLSPVLPMAS